MTYLPRITKVDGLLYHLKYYDNQVYNDSFINKMSRTSTNLGKMYNYKPCRVQLKRIQDSGAKIKALVSLENQETAQVIDRVS